MDKKYQKSPKRYKSFQEDKSKLTMSPKNSYYTLTEYEDDNSSFIAGYKGYKGYKGSQEWNNKKPINSLRLSSPLNMKPRKSKSLILKYDKNTNKAKRKDKKFLTCKRAFSVQTLIPLHNGSVSYLEANLKYRPYMEDFTKSIDNFPKGNLDHNMALYIVCDGHSGEDVSKIAIERFPELFNSYLKENEDEKWNQAFVENALIQCFRKLDEELVHFEEIGSTINIIFMQFEDGYRVIYSANLGDSRSILVKKNDAIRLSYDHKAIDKNEIERVKKEGGIILKKRLYGTLAITRALGDYTFKIDGCGLSVIPYIKRVIVEKDDQYVVMGSDGIWDVINEDQAFKLIHDTQKKENINLSKLFVEKAVELGSKDNICCIVIKLN